MSNDINVQNTLANTRLHKSGKSPVENRKTEDTASGNPASGEAVTVSSQLTRLGELSQKLADMPEVDMQKVAAIKQGLADGSLQIDAEKVAASLLQFEAGYQAKGDK